MPEFGAPSDHPMQANAMTNDDTNSTNQCARATEALRQLLPIFSSIELTVDRMDDVIECSVPLSRHNQSHIGTMYAGVMWSAAEVLGGLLSIAHQDVLGPCTPILAEMSAAFLKKATTKIRARAQFDQEQVRALKAELDKEGRAEFTLAVELRDESDVIVSTTLARYRYRRN